MLQTLKCRTILGHQNLDFSINCLRSFISNSIQPIQLEIFQDGTLQEEDKIKLINNIDNSIIIEKKDSNEIALQRLRAYPYCLKWRLNNFYSLKFFDLMMYDNNEFLYIDTDVFFFQKFCIPKFSQVPVFMVDSYTSYSFSPLDFLRINLPIHSKINSGLYHFPSIYFDLDFIETLLSDPFLQTCIYGKWCGVAEQTLWAFLAARQKQLYVFDPKQIIMASRKMFIDDNTVAVHLTRPFRNYFDKLKTVQFNRKDSESYIIVRLVEKSKLLDNVSFASEWIKSKFESKFNQFLKV